jgi:hypothetical protein
MTQPAMWFRFLLLAFPLALTACGTSSMPPGGDSTTMDGTHTEGDPPVGEITSGLQYGGAIVTAPREDGTRIQLSAPLFPDTTVFQRFQQAGVYDATSPAERLRLVQEDVKTFDDLLTSCAPTHPSITIQAPGDPPLSVDELRTNYDEVANCGYQEYGAKPYWVPQYIDDVDICAEKLGPMWHLPAQSDIDGLGNSDFQFFSDTMTALPGKTSFPVEWYYRLQVYVRGADGSLALGDLGPATTHVSPLPATALLGQLYTGDGKPIGLRCFQSQ